MSHFDQVFAETLGKEGGYTNDPNDSGGPTAHGVTERVARANGYAGRMQDLSIPEAKQIAKLQYWDINRLDSIAALSPEVAREIFDTGYNMGTGRAARFFQRCLTAFNNQGAYYPDLEVDGQIGAFTISALREFLRFRGSRGQTVLLRALNALQASRYIEIAEANGSQESFIFGWLFNRVAL